MTTLLNYDSEQISPDTKLPLLRSPSSTRHIRIRFPILVAGNGPQSGQSVFCASPHRKSTCRCFHLRLQLHLRLCLFLRLCLLTRLPSLGDRLRVHDSLRMRRVAPAAWAWTSPSSVHMFRDPLPGILITSLPSAQCPVASAVICADLQPLLRRSPNLRS